MNYSETIDFLMHRLPMFSRTGQKAFKPGLEHITQFCEALVNPQNKFPTIHIAGTNGKGSVCHLLAGAFQNNGYKTGLYTSPHLVDFRERFRINGQLISQQRVIDFVDQHKKLIEEINPSYFEMAVAMAFQTFADEKVDIAIIETGLGGRLDSTNIIRPELSVITQIGWDHMDILGNTLPKIAGEKAGIIKENIPVVIGERNPETDSVFKNKAAAVNSPIYFAEDDWEVKFKEKNSQTQSFKVRQKYAEKSFLIKTDLRGVYQKHNLTTVLKAIQILRDKNWDLNPQKTIESFERIISLTGLHGRWEILTDQPKIIIEVAHNVGGIEFLKENLREEQSNRNGKCMLLTGFVKDKDVDAVLPYFPEDVQYVFTQANVPRAMPVELLQEKAVKNGLKGPGFTTVAAALDYIFEKIKPQDTLLITGSFFIVGEAIPYLRERGIIPKEKI